MEKEDGIFGDIGYVAARLMTTSRLKYIQTYGCNIP